MILSTIFSGLGPLLTYLLVFNFFFFFLFGEVAQLLVPSPGNEPMTPALGAWSLNH